MNKVPGLNSNVFFDPVGLPFSQVSSIVPFPSGAIAYYRMDESSGAVIDAVNGYNGVNNGATPNVTGKINTAYDFDGLVDYINLDALVTPLATTTQGTWSMWVKPVNALPSTAQVFLSFSDTDVHSFITIAYLSNGSFSIQAILSLLGKWIISTTANDVTAGSWYHLALVQDGVSPVFYVNGIPSGTLTNTNNITSWFNDIAGIDNGRIGDINFTNNTEKLFFDGTIDEVGIWTRALSATEVSNLYNGGNGRQI